MPIDFGLPLPEAARRLGLTVRTEATPREGSVRSGALRLHYLDWDSAPASRPPLVCLHGFAQNAHMWDFTALALADRRRVIALDQRGHGDSDWAPPDEYSLETMQRDLAALVDALGLERFILVGLSMGGRNAFTYVAAHPEHVHALVVVDMGPEVNRKGVERIQGFVAQQDVLDSFDAFVERTLRYMPHRQEWMVRGSLRHNLKQLPDGHWTWKYDQALRETARHGLPSSEQGPEQAWQAWRSIRCPTLIIRGAESDILTRDVAQLMERELPGRGRLVEVPNAGHLVPGDNPRAFEAALGTFLEDLPR